MFYPESTLSNLSQARSLGGKTFIHWEIPLRFNMVLMRIIPAQKIFEQLSQSFKARVEVVNGKAKAAESSANTLVATNRVTEVYEAVWKGAERRWQTEMQYVITLIILITFNHSEDLVVLPAVPGK